MADFTPEHYLVAARIAYPEYEWRIYHPSLAPPIIVQGVAPELWEFTKDLEGHDYRALREALDKEYEIHIKWSQSNQNWFSLPSLKHIAERLIDPMSDDDITRLMMKNVVALVEAGVVE